MILICHLIVGFVFFAQMKNQGAQASAEKIMTTSTSDQLPLYWAWFVEEDYSTSFLQRSHKMLADTLQEIPQFLEDVRRFTQKKYISEILSFYQRENPGEVLHCTSMYNGEFPDYVDGAVEYANNETVKQSVGASSVLHAIGWVLTPRTFGARIKLEDEQLVIWNQNDTEGNPPEARSIDGTDPYVSLDASNFNVKTEDTTDQDPEVLGNFHPTSGRGSRAHLTLGCAPGFGAVTTGLDLVDVIRLENSYFEAPTYSLPEDMGWLRNYGDGQWVFYPKKQWLLQSKFLGYGENLSRALASSLGIVIISCCVSLLHSVTGSVRTVS